MTASAFRHLVGGFVLFAFVAALAALFVVPVPEGNRETIMILIGYLAGYAGAVVTFHYGSSQGSKDKSALLGTNSEGAQ